MMEYSPFWHEVGKRIRVAMKARKISVDDLAKTLCCSRDSVFGYRTRGVKTLDVMIAIADALNVSLDWLMGREGPFENPQKVQEKENGQRVKEGVTHD